MSQQDKMLESLDNLSRAYPDYSPMIQTIKYTIMGISSAQSQEEVNRILREYEAKISNFFSTDEVMF